MEVALLGPTTVTRQEVVVELTGPKRRALLALLALNLGTAIGRDRIIEALWPGDRTGREESTLRVHISHLRDILEAERSESPEVVVTLEAGYMLSADHVTVDIARFEQLRHEAHLVLESEPASALDLLNEALGLWKGRALQDVEYEEFAQDEIRRLDLARTEAIEDRAEALVLLGEDAMAVEDLEAQVRSDPTRERPVRLVMHALYRIGRQAESLAVARRHRRALAELGLEASPVIVELEDRILMHDPALLPSDAIAPADIRPGRAIRGYELRDVAGAGSTSVVYRAFQPAVGRHVAIKVIDRQLADEPAFIQRFSEEAALIASLEHPHIVPLYDFWRDPLGAFLVMRWMEGGSLADRLDKPWTIAEIGTVFPQLGDALAHAHDAGVVHRDVTPRNVMFDSGNNAYLCDFGLAVAGAGQGRGEPARMPPAPYRPPETLRNEMWTVTADVFGLGVMLGQVLDLVTDGEPTVLGGLHEVVEVATAPDPADRYPDVEAFRSAVLDAVGPAAAPAPRRVRRNPYKGLAPFEEADRADFYGRDDLVETLLSRVSRYGLVSVVGASGSGKSSLVRAGLIPQLRIGSLPGSDQWSIITMKPGLDPYEEFFVALRQVALGDVRVGPGESLRAAIESALGGPRARCLLLVDQFEELFSASVDSTVREQFIDELVDLATDAGDRNRVVVTIRADFADRPLAHPRLGDLLAQGSLVIAPMRPDQIEDVVRRPAARVGVQAEPGLISEIARDLATSRAALPLLQYVLTELFERRTEDRLTVAAYRQLGGVRGVLERQAEVTYNALGPDARHAARQLFLRMVQLGDRAEETRRRLPLDELDGLGSPGAVDAALDAFVGVRLLAFDRDPVSRTPTVEVAHEAVITEWTRYRVWIEEAKADLAVQRRLTSAAQAWAVTDEDTDYLLSGGPLVAALEVAASGRVRLNDFESRFLEESRVAAESARRAEAERRRHELHLEKTARRRLRVGLAVTSALVVVAVLGSLAWVERRRADTLAAQAAGESMARRLAAQSLNSLAGSDPDLSLLLAIAAAEESLGVTEAIIDEAVDALHRAVINPRPSLEVTGLGTAAGGHVIDYSPDGDLIVALGGGDDLALVIESATGNVVSRLPAIEGAPARGVLFHPGGEHVLTIHSDGVRAFRWETGELDHVSRVEGTIVAAAASPTGEALAMANEDGMVVTAGFPSGVTLARWQAHPGGITSIDFDSEGRRLLTTGLREPAGWTLVVWDSRLGIEETRVRPSRFFPPVLQAAWTPATWENAKDAIAVTAGSAEVFVLDGRFGDTITVMGNANRLSRSVSFNQDGTLVLLAGVDGKSYGYSTWVGGEVAFTLPAGGVPLRDAEFNPVKDQIATITVDGTLRVWNHLVRSELPEYTHWMLGTSASASDAGERVIIGGYHPAYGLPTDVPAEAVVMDASDMEVVRRIEVAVDLELLLARVEMSGDGTLVAYVGTGRQVEIMEVESGATVVIPDSRGWVASLSFSPDNRLLAGGDVASLSSFSPDNRLLAGGDVAAFGESVILVWDTSTGEVRHRLTGHGPPVPANDPRQSATLGTVVDFNPVSGDLVSGGFDGTVRRWDFETGQSTILHTSDFEIISVAVSHRGEMIAVADATGGLVLLDTETGVQIRRLEAVSGRSFLAFSSDDSMIAGAGPDPITNLWDVETGRIIRRFHGSIYPAKSVAFLEGRDVLLIASGESVQRRYLLDPFQLLDHARSLVSRQMTDEECLRYLDRACDG